MVALQNTQANRFPPSVNTIKGHMYALHLVQRTGPKYVNMYVLHLVQRTGPKYVSM